MNDQIALIALAATLAVIGTYTITVRDYQPEPLGGFGEGNRPMRVLDAILAWRNTWKPEPLGGFNSQPAPNMVNHTGHSNNLVDFVSFVFEASGPVPGVLEINSQTGSVGAIKNYKPRNGKSIEFIYDPSQGIFAVGQPKYGSFGLSSGHQRLVQVSGANDREVVAGMFTRGPNGEILTNEFSGHFGTRWTTQNRQQFVEFLEQATGVPVNHSEWGN